MKHTLKPFAGFAGALAVLTTCGILRANEEPSTPSEDSPLDSVRYLELDDGAAQLQTGTTRFWKKDGVIIDLVGVVHMGDEDYYRELNRKLAYYDAVLYEMVGGPAENRNQGAAKPGGMSLVHIMQKVMQNALGFQYQLSGIDYSQPNFIHADATQKQFEELLSSRNQSMLGLMAGAMQMENSEEMQEQMEKIGGEELSIKMAEAVAEMNPNKFKRGMAPMLANSETYLQEMSGDLGAVLIEERNKIVMDIIDQQIALGKRRIAVFYGAGHMPDFKERLVAKGFNEAQTNWDVAWHIGAKDESVSGFDIIGNLLTDEDLLKSISGLFRSLTEG